MGTLARAPRLVIVSSQFHPAVGGAERQAIELAVALRRRGVPVVALTLHNPLRPRACGYMPVPMVGIDYPRARVVGPALAYWRGALALRRLTRRRPVVVQLQTLDQFTLVAGLAARFWGLPVVVRISGAVEMSDGYLSPQQGPRPWLARWLVRHATRVLALNPEIEARLRSVGVHDQAILRLPNAIPDKFFDLQNPGARVEAQTKRTTVLSVGRLHRFKGGNVLLQAWQTTAAASPAARLDIVGDGPERPALEALAGSLSITGSVTFRGASFDVARFYAEASIFVLPSIEEGMPNALLEAMAAGLPCIASDLPSTRGIIVDGQSGMLVPPGNPRALADAMMRLLTDAETRHSLGRAARDRVGPWALSRIVETHMELHRQLCGDSATIAERNA